MYIVFAVYIVFTMYILCAVYIIVFTMYIVFAVYIVFTMYLYIIIYSRHWVIQILGIPYRNPMKLLSYYQAYDSCLTIII